MDEIVSTRVVVGDEATKHLNDIAQDAVLSDGVDICMIVVDAAKRLDSRKRDSFCELVALALRGRAKEVVLVLNKVDWVEPKSKLLDLTYEYVSLVNGVKVPRIL